MIGKHIRRKLLKSDPACWYCGRELCERGGPGTWATLEHLRPKSAGGTNASENLVLSCQRCNGYRGHRPLETIVCYAKRGGGVVLAAHVDRWIRRATAR